MLAEKNGVEAKTIPTLLKRYSANNQFFTKPPKIVTDQWYWMWCHFASIPTFLENIWQPILKIEPISKIVDWPLISKKDYSNLLGKFSAAKILKCPQFSSRLEYPFANNKFTNIFSSHIIHCYKFLKFHQISANSTSDSTWR